MHSRKLAVVLLYSLNYKGKKLDELYNFLKYSKQKCSLRAQLSSFQESLAPPKDLLTAKQEDIRSFLIFKEKDGRTQLHDPKCTFEGLTGKQKCDCPATLAAKTTDSLIGKIRAIFRDLGRSGAKMESEDDDICPVRLLKSYIDFSLEADIDLSYSYLFRVRDKAKNQVINKPVHSSSMTDRLRTHLRAVNLHDGESSHSSMHGCAITLMCLSNGTPKNNKFSICSKWKIHYF